VAISERQLASSEPLAGLDDVECIFGANPNNPTGAHLSARQLMRLGVACAERGVILVIDCCFRGFDHRVQFDHYAVLDETGVEYVVLEDTGKLWPMTGLKLGFSVSSSRNRLPLDDAASDVILSAPGIVALLVEALAEDMADGGMEQIHSLIAANRSAIASELDGCPMARQVDGTSLVSVSRVQVDKPLSATRLWGDLMRQGICAVPCRPFYWSRPSHGERFLRIALARDPEVVTRAAVALRACIESRA
jgi:aspartate/methionine/tyrosine aminotransferase